MTNTPKKPEKSEASLPESIKLSDLSVESLEVLDYFGIEAPEKLNQYAMSLEDGLIEQVAKNKKLLDENKHLKQLLTDNNISFES